MENKLKELFKNAYSCEPDSIKKLSPEGSNRMYYRLTKANISVVGCIGTYVEENNAFVYIAHHFAEKNLPVPRIINVSSDGIAYLQEDLGDESLYGLIANGRNLGGKYNRDEIELLKKTISQLPHFQFRGAQGFDFNKCFQCKSMDSSSVMFDLNYFKYCFLKLADIYFDEYKLEHDFMTLRDVITSVDSNTFLYRDFQARNVMMLNRQPYFIDFQGGRKGPFYYDVASFLWQASSCFDDDLRDILIDEYLNVLAEYVQIDKCEFVSNLKTFVLFRTLQVLGAYGYRGLWEKKKHFISSIPNAIANLKSLVDEGVCDSYPEIQSIALRLSDSELASSKSKENNVKSSVADLLQNDNGYLATNADNSTLVVRVNSFSFKKGIPIDDSGNGGGYVFDCRATHNPGRYEPYKKLTGLDPEVIEFLESDGEILVQLESMYRLVDFHVNRYIERGFTNLMISCGCTGGQHRSVYCAQHIAEYINSKYGVKTMVDHREQNISYVFEHKPKL